MSVTTGHFNMPVQPVEGQTTNVARKSRITTESRRWEKASNIVITADSTIVRPQRLVCNPGPLDQQHPAVKYNPTRL